MEESNRSESVRELQKARTPLLEPSSTARNPFDAFFELPYMHALLNADLALIQNPGDQTYVGQGVESKFTITGVAATKSQTPVGALGYSTPNVSILTDLWILGSGERSDCLVLSDIAPPFTAGTSTAKTITVCTQPPALTSSILGYLIDHVEVGALSDTLAAALRAYNGTPLTIRLLHDHLFKIFDREIRMQVGADINTLLATLNSPIPFEITVGDVMAPFLCFDIPAFDLAQGTIDIVFDPVGFSTVLRTVDPKTKEVLFGTAISLIARGKAHLSPTGLDMAVNYLVNLGTGPLPLPSKYSAQINAALIPKLESYVKQLLPAQRTYMLAELQYGLPARRSG